MLSFDSLQFGKIAAKKLIIHVLNHCDQDALSVLESRHASVAQC